VLTNQVPILTQNKITYHLRKLRNDLRIMRMFIFKTDVNLFKNFSKSLQILEITFNSVLDYLVLLKNYKPDNKVNLMSTNCII
jgi:hypothetical protein